MVSVGDHANNVSELKNKGRGGETTSPLISCQAIIRTNKGKILRFHPTRA